jgi:hypothetical protein
MDLSLLGKLPAWLAQEGAHAAKHHGWSHPIAVVICHYTALIIVAFGAHDWMMTFETSPLLDPTPDCTSFRQNVALFLACYSIWFLPWRIKFCHPQIPRNSVLYEFTWLCTGTLVLGSLALASDRPVIAAACCVTVGIDQLMWYVDLAGYLMM